MMTVSVKSSISTGNSVIDCVRLSSIIDNSILFVPHGGQFQIKVHAHHQSITMENQGRIMEVFKLHIASSHVF